jgi:hypothetical protein
MHNLKEVQWRFRGAPSLPTGRRRTSPALAVCLVLLALTGCSVKFIGDYDAQIDSGISEIQARAETYFWKLKNNPSTPYDPAFYDDINGHLVALRTRAHILPQYPIIEQQIENLQSQFADFQKLDQSMPRPFPFGAVNAAESAITISVESILKLELALKRGDKNAPTVSAH